jgi:hypothetical protein
MHRPDKDIRAFGNAKFTQPPLELTSALGAVGDACDTGGPLNIFREHPGHLCGQCLRFPAAGASENHAASSGFVCHPLAGIVS